MLACAQPALAQGRIMLSGVIRDSAGVPVANVELRVDDAPRARSDQGGGYRISGLSSGDHTIEARRLGYRKYSQLLRLDSGRDHGLDIVLAIAPEMLTAVDVAARREVYDARLAGFNERSKRQVGHFVTRERIDRANSTILTDVLREMPGVRIGPMRNQGKAIRLRGADCPPLVFVDGFPATAGEFDVDIIDLKSVEGIEVYAGLGSIPPEFSGPRDLDRCGVIAIWSRPFRPMVRAANAQVAATLAALKADPNNLAEVKTVAEVDTPARLLAGTTPPQYPDSLYTAKLAGRVVVEFVVDTTGMVEDGTLDVLTSTHPLFTEAVRVSLGSARFIPAFVGSRRVRQFVQLPFTFSPRDAPVAHGKPPQN